MAKSIQVAGRNRKSHGSKKSLGNIFKKEWQYHALLFPGMLVLFIFCYIPLGGIAIAFEDYIPSKGIFGSEFAGLYWFKYAMNLPDVWRITKNTFVIAGLKTILGFPVPIIFALLLNEVSHTRYKKSIQTILYLPNFLSWVIVSGIIIDVFALSGGINQILGMFGIEPIYFLGNETAFRWLIIGSDIWKNFGWGTVIYMSALAGVDPALYEAAAIDGANRWKQTLHVTLPGIAAVIMMVGVLSLGNLINAGFDQIFNLYNPLVMNSADIIDTYTYRLAFEQASWSLSTAVGLLKSLVSTTFIGIGYWLAYKLTDYRIF